MPYLFLVLGLVVLVFSGEILIKGAVSIALRLKISMMVVGLTVVAFGTSAPELLVSIQAALSGAPDISMGNIMGSNICNIALVLGITALIYPIPVVKKIKIDWVVMIGASLLLFLFILDGQLSLYEGMVFVSILILYISWTIIHSRKENKKIEDQVEQSQEHSLLKSILFIVAGAIGLLFGARWMVDAAVDIARLWGVGERVIGLSLVALGTSVPEITTSILAARKGETDISLGNILGSNIFNILSILGITSMLKNIPINDLILGNDIYWMLGVSLLLLPLMLFRKKLAKAEGLILLACYIVYISLLFA